MENRAERDRQPAGQPRRGERSEAIQHQKTRHWQVSKVPPGSSQVVACVENRSEAEIDCLQGSPQGRLQADQKRKDDHPAEGGTLNSGRLIAPAVEEIYLQQSNDFQPIEGVAKSHQESDL